MIDIDTIIRIESSGISDNVSPKGAIGLMGIMPIVLEDWNERHLDNKFTKKQLKDVDTNIAVGSWYLNERIPELLAEKNIAPSIEAILSAYSMGASALDDHIKGRREFPEETRDYLIKYRMGGDVTAGQQRLKEMGFDPGPIDGKFGPKTRAAFQQFQESDVQASPIQKFHGIQTLKR